VKGVNSSLRETIFSISYLSFQVGLYFHSKSRGHRLGLLAKYEFVNYDQSSAHRADYDAEILSKIYERFLHKLLSNDIRNLNSLNGLLSNMKDFIFSKHITAISKNNKGLKDLNKLVSSASVDYLNKRKKIPMLPLSLFFEKERFKNLLIGSSCSNGFLFIADYHALNSIRDAKKLRQNIYSLR